jgi:hypothetical protein
MYGAGSLRGRLRRWRLPPVQFGEAPKAQAAGQVLGRSHPDVRCELALLRDALAVIVTAKHSRRLHLLYFEHLAYLEPATHSPREHAYEVWDHAHPDGPRGLAFAVEDSRRGRAFVARLEETVRRRRPDLLRGRPSAELDLEGRRLLEPPELFADAVWRPPTASARRTIVHDKVFRRARRKPEAHVRQLLEHELQRAGLTWWPESDEAFARAVANEPPFLVGALSRLIPGRRRRLDAQDQQADPVPAIDPEMDALSDQLLELPGVRGVGWHSEDSDRAIEVQLDPWSEETAERVRRLAAPRVVRFTP